MYAQKSVVRLRAVIGTCVASVFENTYFTFFQNSKKRVFLRLLEMTCQKNVENAIKVSVRLHA